MSSVTVAGPVGAVALTMSGLAVPTANDGMVQLSGLPLPLQFQPVPVALTNVAPNRLLMTRMLWAVLGPWLTTLIVKVTAPPLATGFGAPLMVTFRSATEVTFTDAVPVD